MRIVFDQKRGKGQKNKNKGDGKSEYGWGSIGRRGTRWRKQIFS